MNVTEQRLETKAVELEKQLDAAKQRLEVANTRIENHKNAIIDLSQKLLTERTAKEAAERKLATARSEAIQECADWITETELALPIAWHMGTKDELVKKFALCLASCLRMEMLDKHCYLYSEETLDSARRVQALAQIEQPQSTLADEREDLSRLIGEHLTSEMAELTGDFGPIAEAILESGYRKIPRPPETVAGIEPDVNGLEALARRHHQP